MNDSKRKQPLSEPVHPNTPSVRAREELTPVIQPLHPKRNFLNGEKKFRALTLARRHLARWTDEKEIIAPGKMS